MEVSLSFDVIMWIGLFMVHFIYIHFAAYLQRDRTGLMNILKVQILPSALVNASHL